MKIQKMVAQNTAKISISSNAFTRPMSPKVTADGNDISAAKPILTQTTSLTQDGRKRIQPIFLAGNASSTNRPTTLNQTLSQPTNINSLNIPVKMTGEKRKQSEDALFSAVKRQVPNGSRLEDEKGRSVTYLLPTWIDTKQPVNLGLPSVEDKCVKSIIINKENNDEAIMEAINYAGGMSKIQCKHGDTALWADKLSAEVIHLGGSTKFYVASTVDGKLYIYTAAGRRLFPAIVLDSAVSILECTGDFLLYITSLGRLSVM
jgi:protein HIRA/HIR1